MSSDLNVYMKVLPQFVGKYIFSFLIPDAESVEFGDYKRTKREDSGYCLKYEVAFCGNRLLENFKGMYLSRIKKATGKHRYYLTTEHYAHICQGCGMDGCRSEYCRGGWEDEKWYSSKYVGKDLENAMCVLMLSVLDNSPTFAPTSQTPGIPEFTYVCSYVTNSGEYPKPVSKRPIQYLADESW